MVERSEPAAAKEFLYAGFISYSHRDRNWAQWLHRAIENYRVPDDVSASRLTLRTPRALKPVFLDRAELPTSSDLAASVTDALEKSAYLLVVCSVSAAKSRWVNEEIRQFRAMGSADRILCLIVDGDPAASGSAPDTACFPPALLESGSDPMAADVRPGMDDRRLARLKILASLLGVPLDALVKRDQARRHRRLVVTSTAATLGCLAFAALALMAALSRNEAQRQQQIAVQQSMTSRRTADFLESLFSVTDPSEARGRSITALEVLNRGVQQIKTQLKDEPTVRGELTTTLGEVYTRLGLLQEGTQLLIEAQSLPERSPSLAVRQAAALGEANFERRDLPAAIASLTYALALLERTPQPEAQLRQRVLAALADVYLAQTEYTAARHTYQQAGNVAVGDSNPSLVARVAEGLAQCDLFEKNYDSAQLGLEQALAAQLAATGELHPRTAEILNELGSLAYLRGHRDAAAKYFRRTIEIERRVLGERHPDLAVTRNNLARMLLEKRQFAESRSLLREALATRTAEVVDTDDQMAFVFSNLALADVGIGDWQTAREMFLKGLHAAVINKHRLHGPILTDLADLECRTGRYREGLSRLSEARPIVAARYPDDIWRVAYVDNVRVGCLTGTRRYIEAERLMQSSMPIVLKQWPPDTMYGHDTLERSIQLYTRLGDEAGVARYSALLRGN